MVWNSKEYYWLPAEGEYDDSIKLTVSDGWRIELTMTDCMSKTYLHYDKNCGCGEDFATRELTLEQLKELSAAIIKAIEEYK